MRVASKTNAYIEDSEIFNNLAGEGAGVNAGGNLTLKRVKIENNRSSTSGGGIYFSGNTLSIDSCIIRDNKGYNGGGGIYLWGGNQAEITNTDISKNGVTNGDYSGGGIISFIPLKMSNCVIYENTATYGAGLAYIFSGNESIELANNTFYNNISKTKGGGIHITLIYGTLKDAWLYLPTYPKVTLLNNTIVNNQANEGGGVYFETYLYHSGYGEFYLYNNLITSNSNGDFVRHDDNQSAITYFKGKSNIASFKGSSVNMDSEFISYNSESIIFSDNNPTLADNGGFTRTIAIADNSIAKAKGVNNIVGYDIPLTDQRGYKRNTPSCIGAFELTGADVLPVIKEHPSDKELYAHEKVSFVVRAEGEYLKYQWYKDNAKIDKANTDILTINSVKYSDIGEYYCIVNSNRGEVISDKAKLLVVLKDVEIITHPQNITTPIGNNISLFVETIGDEITFQWFKNETIIIGANKSILNLNQTILEDTGNYYCVVKNATSEEISSSGSVLIYDNISLQSVYIDDQLWNIEDHFIVSEENVQEKLRVKIYPYDLQSKVYYNDIHILDNIIEIDVSKPCVKDVMFDVFSSDLDNKRSYKLSVEKYFNFDVLVTERWNNTLTVINNPLFNGGFNFIAYKWFKDKAEVGSKQFYSAGSQKNDKLNPNSKYYVEVVTENGQVLRTTEKQITLKTNSLKVYPTIISQGEIVFVEIDMDKEYFEENIYVDTFHINGRYVGRYKLAGTSTPINLPASSGVYILNIKSNNFVESIKVIVK